MTRKKAKILLILLTPLLILILRPNPPFLPIDNIYVYLRIKLIESGPHFGDERQGPYISEAVDKLKSSAKDQEFLMHQMLNSEEGSIVAEGMVLAYEIAKNINELHEWIDPFENDERWNYWVTYNEKMYDWTITAYKIKTNAKLTQSEQVGIAGWFRVLEQTYGLPMP